jgi:hypothetical protein
MTFKKPSHVKKKRAPNRKGDLVNVTSYAKVLEQLKADIPANATQSHSISHKRKRHSSIGERGKFYLKWFKK